ncbi:MAG: AMP-binding protein [Paracoccaceae bacterium]
MTRFDSPFGALPISDLTVTQRLFQGLADRPDDTVLIDGPTGRAMTAAALTDTIKRLAGGLVESGRGTGHVVALMAPNMPEFCTVFHGVAWAGGTITTINPTYTAHEVRHQLTASGAGTLITTAAFLDMAEAAIEGTGVAGIHVIGDSQRGASFTDLFGPPLEEQVPVDLDRHVLVLPYSSGTTGMPKGVMLSHRNLVMNVEQVLSAIEIQPGEVTVAFLPFFHIYGMNVLMNAFLSARGALVTMPRFDLEAFLRLTQEHKARQLWVVPPVALALAKHPMVGDFDLSSVEHVVSGAAPLGADLSNLLAERLGCVSGQGYGMTELSPVSHVTPMTAPRAGAAGMTVAGTACRIVDIATGEDLGPGEEGELWVKGPQVMQGYLDNPQATASTLVEDGWLRTGDLGWIDADGYLFISDRVKELIKYKGFQIAPAELEAALLAHAGIADAAVIGEPDPEAGEVPVAFLVPAGVAPPVDDIMAHMAERLAHFKQLHRIEFVDAIPKSASGKILRRQLRQPPST